MSEQINDELLIEQLKESMERLDFVEWDRYVTGEWDEHNDYVIAYGWIERESDAYKDYVELITWSKGDNVMFTTSSSKYTEEIYRLLYGEEPDDHNDCKRIENAVDIDNAIEL